MFKCYYIKYELYFVYIKPGVVLHFTYAGHIFFSTFHRGLINVIENTISILNTYGVIIYQLYYLFFSILTDFEYIFFIYIHGALTTRQLAPRVRNSRFFICIVFFGTREEYNLLAEKILKS